MVLGSSALTLQSSSRSKHDVAAASTTDLNFISGDELAGRLQDGFCSTYDSTDGPPSFPSGTVGDGTMCRSADSGDFHCRSSATAMEIVPVGQPANSPSSPSPPVSPGGGSYRKLVLIDLRSMFLFQESHVRESINLTNCPLVSKRIQDGKLQIKEYLEARLLFDGSQDIVIYEQGPPSGSGCQLPSASSAGTGSGDPRQESEEGNGMNAVTDFAKLIFKNLKNVSNKEARIEILQGGFDSFRKAYPNHCTQGVPFVARYFISNVSGDDESTYLNWEATEVRKNIFIGALHDAKNDKLLDRHNITHILNCCRTASRGEGVTDCGRGKYKYRELQCDDNLQQSLAGKLDDAFQFIDEAVRGENGKKGGKVLIHCYAGVSRSAAITIAYLMYAYNLTYHDSYRELKQKRSIVAPNISFVAQLMKYDDHLKAKKKNVSKSSPSSPVIMEIKQPPPHVPLAGSSARTKVQLQNLKLDALNLKKDSNEAQSTGFAAKRKMLLPLKINVAASAVPREGASRFENIASAPIMPTNYNPFCSAFKKANTNKNSFSSSLKTSNELSSAFPKCSFGAPSFSHQKNSSIPE